MNTLKKRMIKHAQVLERLCQAFLGTVMAPIF